MRCLPVCLALLAALLSPAAAAPPDGLMARTLGPTPVLDDLRQLADEIGGRPTGSPALDRAIGWAQLRFKAAGVDAVRVESYRAPRLWLPQRESGELTAPGRGTALRVAALPFSTATAGAGREAEVADVGSGDQAGFVAAGTIKGHWVLVHSEPMHSLEDLFKEYLNTPPILERARQGGAAGVLWMSTRPGRLLYRHNATLDGTLFPLPGAIVEREGALRIARLRAGGQTVRVRLTLQSEAPSNAPVRNVVAEVRGGALPDEKVILGAHLDSWDLGRGALDNGCNVALVIDAARQIAASARAGQRPRRTIRFVLYAGEEAGMWGSFAEAHARRAELDRVRAQIVFDIGTGRTTGFSLGGRADLQAAADAALAAVSGLGPFAQTLDAFVGTDNYDYLVEGVPTLVANQEGAPYLPDYHAESDTFDKIDVRELRANVAIAVALAWGLADAVAPPAPRQSRAQVEALLKATHLDEQMKTFNLWSSFQSGARGRARE